MEVAAEFLLGLLGDMDHAGHSRGFHPAGHIDRVTPEIVGELDLADDSGDHRTGVDADTHLEFRAVEFVEVTEGIDHFQRGGRNDLRMIVPVGRQPADHHVAVADRLDLLHAVTFHDRVKRREDPVEHGDEIGGIGLAGESGESAQIGKHDGDRRVAVGDRLLPTLETPGDRSWKNVEEKLLRLLFLQFDEFLLGLELCKPELVQITETLLFQRRGHAGPEQCLVGRLGKIILRARLDALDSHLDLFTPGNHDDRNPLDLGVQSHRGQDLDAVHLRHLHVEEHQVVGFLVQFGDGIPAIHSLGDIVEAELFERSRETGPHHAAVVDDQNLGLCQGMGNLFGTDGFRGGGNVKDVAHREVC